MGDNLFFIRACFCALMQACKFFLTCKKSVGLAPEVTTGNNETCYVDGYPNWMGKNFNCLLFDTKSSTGNLTKLDFEL